MRTNNANGRGGRASVSAQPFQIRGRFITAIAIRLGNEDFDAAFYEALDEQLRQAPQLLLDAPLILDLGMVPGLTETAALRGLVDQLRGRDLQVFGVQNVSDPQAEVAAELGLIPVTIGRDIPAEKAGNGGRRKIDKLLPPDNKLITTPVRSGQVIFAERGDLTVVGSVSSGAELIASGNIHVYGTLRGRAIAGAHGNESARIFCLRQEAELLAIAGVYRTSESIGDTLRGQSLQVFLKDEGLHLEALT
ncbi:septum site-determining protein MinC [Pseudodonghicola xiamenensis]|uniref:Probable septum site-determining protein MinC n=1 Tax=Pseudodonghicola xiamenensis TaxID=337702 RepID=A0A8J3HA09_9RHOB|nr:septum site-determining protein MinC [Pseudodonghicola xiamenensis]GHG94137.1 putative septum site-determining protein MinC [Pseudodonghicola xiamenensis]